mgnify:FL=1|jgi:hypothetical protein
MKVTGKIENILETQTGTSKAGKEWKKTSFVVKTDDEYNNLYCFDVFGDEKVNNFLQYNSKGDVVDVDFNVKTNEWKGKYFTSLDAWKIFKADNSKQKEEVAVEEEGDLPF